MMGYEWCVFMETVQTPKVLQEIIMGNNPLYTVDMEVL